MTNIFEAYSTFFWSKAPFRLARTGEGEIDAYPSPDGDGYIYIPPVGAEHCVTNATSAVRIGTAGPVVTTSKVSTTFWTLVFRGTARSMARWSTAFTSRRVSCASPDAEEGWRFATGDYARSW